MRTLALRALIGSIALSALTGIYVLIVGSGGDLEGKVLVTALSISVVSILVMACGAGLERRKLSLLPHAGTAAAVASFMLLMIDNWELSTHRVWMQCGLTLALVSIAAALACLLSLAALEGKFRWVRALGFFCDAALAIMLTLFVWEIITPPNEIFARMTGVLAVLLGAVTIAVPILQRMSSPEPNLRGGANSGGTSIVSHCVACGQRVQDAHEDELTCSACGARFRVEFLQRS